jgi:tRNA(Ile)-lysidine synthase
VLAACRRHGFPSAGTRVVVAVSGGADSLCLLLVLDALRPVLGCALTVAHVHHGLRGAEADRDQAFVLGLAAEMGLPCLVERVDVRAGKRPRESEEAAARRLRYAALRRLAASAGAECIAVAHTLDDQAETVLQHLLRGAGIDGLAGMRAHQGDVARPLLEISRRQVEDCLRAFGRAPCQDATNGDRRYQRNAVRLDVLPALERLNPRARQALARGASILAQDAEYLRLAAGEALARLRLTGPPPGIALDRAGLAALHPGLRAHVLRQAWEEAAGTRDGLGQSHLLALDALVLGGAGTVCASLPKGQAAEVAGGTFRLFPAALIRTGSPSTVELPVPGTVRFGPWRVRTRAVATGELPWLEVPEAVDSVQVVLRADSLCLPLRVRGRLPGDRLRPPGVHGHRKLQDILVDAKVPRSERDHIPLVVDESGIVWVAGFMQDARTRVLTGADSVVVMRAWRTETGHEGLFH